MQKTLFEKIGGAAAVEAAVDIFYDKVLADRRVNVFFASTDMAKQRAHQKRFLTYAFGGAEKYTGQSLRTVHSNLVAEKGLNDEHFNIIVTHLGTTLAELGVTQDCIKEVVQITESIRNEILNR